MNLVVHTDGGARGNPGPAAVGVVIGQGTGKIIAAFGKKIGETTNNVAEYTAVIEAMRWLRNNPIIPASPAGRQSANNPIIQFYLDSTLVVNQLNGLFKIKHPHLRELLVKVRELEGEIGGVFRYHSVPREQNTLADALVNEALDS